MATQIKEERVKLRMKYDKGSQTLSQCKPTADNDSLYAAAMAIYGLRKDEEVEITKIVEADLIEGL